MEKSHQNLFEADTLCFVFKGHRLLLTHDMQIPKSSHVFLQNCQFARQLLIDIEHNSTSSPIAAELTADTLIPHDLQWLDLKALYHLFSSHLITLAGKAFQLLEWDRSHQFCGECASGTLSISHEHARICANESCQRIFYPRVAPVIMVAIERDKEILLARSPHFPPHMYSALAGFVAPGESIEEAIHREVYEEVGLYIKNLRYFKSQPWPFPNSLMIGFQADYDSGTIICAPNEIEDAAFFDVEHLPKTFSGKISLSKWLIQDFYQRQQGKELAE